MNPRSSLFVGVVSVGLLAAVVGYFILQTFAPDAANARALVDCGLLVALAMVVMTFTRTPAHRVDDLADAIVELTRGNRSRRLDPGEYGELEAIARAFNEIASHMSAQEDPNLGPIKRRPRLRGVGSEDSGPQSAPHEAENPEVSKRIRDLSDLAKNHSYHPELGPVRVMAEADDENPDAASPAENQELRLETENGTQKPTSADLSDSQIAEEVREPVASVEADRNSTLRLVTNEYTRNGTEAPHGVSQLATAADAADVEPEAAAKSTNDTDIDALLQASETSANGDAERVAAGTANGNGNAAIAAAMVNHNSNISSLPPESVSTTPQLSDGERMRALFEAFVQAKQEQEEAIEDLEFDSFAAMVSEERVKLRQAHECRDVRFEVTVNSGEVSLLPRLLR